MADKKPGRGRKITRRMATVLVGALAGLLFVAAATTSHGSDLRPTRQQDMADLVAAQATHNSQARSTASALQSQVNELSNHDAEAAGVASASMASAEAAAGLTAVRGPVVQVTLTDAPLDENPAGVDPDMLVVHQQDIQQVVDALWAGGAEAMTLQGIRVISTTGVKCVGNTVILNGVPYSPPYVVAAIGDQQALEQSLAASRNVQIYKQYVLAYRLGYDQKRIADVTMPGYAGSVQLNQATPVR